MQTAPGADDGSVQLRTSALSGTRIGDLTALSYSTYASSWNGSQLPYLTIWVDNDNNGSADDRLWFEPAYSNGNYGNNNPYPAQGPVALNTWQTWNTLQGMWYTDSSFSGPGADAIPLSTYLAAFPDATIVNDAGQGIGGFRITTGFASGSDNFNTNVDNVTFATAAGSTTFNFEGAAAVPLPSSAVAGIVILALFALFQKFGKKLVA